MFILIFDEGTENERSIGLNSFYERPMFNSFTGTLSVQVEKKAEIPNVRGFADEPDFRTVKAVNSDGVEIPVSGDYDAVTDVSVSYDDGRKFYNISVTLGKKPAPAEEEPNE